MPAEWTDAEYELLSAYIDEQLDDSERTALEARLAEDPDLRQELAAMRQTVTLLHSLPTIQAPRAFTLTPEMVGQTAVPVVSLTQPPSADSKIRPLQPRRFWWIPAASAAGVVLLAGVLFVTQNVGQAPSSGSVAMRPTLVASTATLPPTPMPDGSALNTVILDTVPQSTVLPPPVQQALPQTQQSVIQANILQATSTLQSTETLLLGEILTESEEAGGEAANPMLVPGSAPSTQLILPEPVDLSDEQEAAPLPGALSSTPVPSAMMTAAPANTPQPQEDAPRQSATVMSETANYQADGTSPDFSAPSGAGGIDPITAGMGMGGIDTNVNMPGFTVATMSPPLATQVEMYNTLNQQSVGVASDSAESVTTTGAESEVPTSAKREPIWIRWFNSLVSWVEQLLSDQ